MTNENPSSTATRTSNGQNSWMNFALLSFFCAFLMGILTWATDSYSPEEPILNPDPAKSYYNLLVQGFQSGQLNLKMDTPPEFAKLADPYNPRHGWSTGIWANKLDTSYYRGKFYLYFGVTPALALFWPYATFTRHYLADNFAVVVFFALGFLFMWAILCALRRRYFPETNFGIFAPGIFILGLDLCLVQSGSIYDVAKVSGFSFMMLALGGIWLALHWPARRNGCLLLASLSYGLAAGARQSLLFGAIILLIPVLQAWFEPPAAISRRQVAVSFLSAMLPIALIGIGLMVYNGLRFDSPFEFGRRYMLTGDYESTTAQQFSLHYLWFNFRYYFLEPISISGHFPFLQDFIMASPPPGHSPGYSEYSGILFNYPLIMLVFAVPLVWRDRSSGAISALGWFILALFLLFLACALTDCFFLAAQWHYTLDFLPPLIMLAFIGFLGLDRFSVHSPGRRRLVRLGWYLLLGYSLAFNTFANIKARALSYYDIGERLLEQNRPDAALKYLQMTVSLEPRQPIFYNQLAVAYSKMGRTDAALDELKKALAIDPNRTQAQYNVAALLYQSGRSKEAFEYFEKALNGDPKTSDFYALDNIAGAWLLVSSPDPGRRNGPLAVKLAKAACQETGYKDALALVVSAEVFGKTSRTNEAISLAQKAVAVAQQNGQSNLLDKANSLLAAYQKKPR